MNNGPWKHGGSDSGRLFCFLLRLPTQFSMIRPTTHRGQIMQPMGACFIPLCYCLNNTDDKTSKRATDPAEAWEASHRRVSMFQSLYYSVVDLLSRSTVDGQVQHPTYSVVLRSRHRRCGHIDNRQLAAL